VIKQKQTLLFSATMSDALMGFENAHIYKGEAPTHAIQEEYIFCPERVKEVYLYAYLVRHKVSTIIFVNKVKTAEILSKMLHSLHIINAPLHSHLSQSNREASLARFRNGMVDILVCTDVCARGLDIPHCACVLNYDVPNQPSEYIHRIGRTRIKAVSITSERDIVLVQAIEKLGHVLKEYDVGNVLDDLKKVSIAKRSAIL